MKAKDTVAMWEGVENRNGCHFAVRFSIANNKNNNSRHNRCKEV